LLRESEVGDGHIIKHLGVVKESINKAEGIAANAIQLIENRVSIWD
jgi:hypothetical protein